MCRVKEDVAAGGPEMRKSLPHTQSPVSGSAELLCLFSTTPRSSSNLCKEEAENPLLMGVRNPGALSGAGGHRYVMLLS